MARASHSAAIDVREAYLRALADDHHKSQYRTRRMPVRHCAMAPPAARPPRRPWRPAQPPSCGACPALRRASRRGPWRGASTQALPPSAAPSGHRAAPQADPASEVSVRQRQAARSGAGRARPPSHSMMAARSAQASRRSAGISSPSGPAIAAGPPPLVSAPALHASFTSLEPPYAAPGSLATRCPRSAACRAPAPAPAAARRQRHGHGGRLPGGASLRPRGGLAPSAWGQRRRRCRELLRPASAEHSACAVSSAAWRASWRPGCCPAAVASCPGELAPRAWGQRRCWRRELLQPAAPEPCAWQVGRRAGCSPRPVERLTWTPAPKIYP